MEEIWKSVPGFDGLYDVSNHGRVRVRDRHIRRGNGNFTRFMPSRVLKLGLNNSGYPQVVCHDNLRRKGFRVSTLVALLFIGERPRGFQVCHNDGNRLNNRVDNLRYDTPKANHADRVEHGTDPVGERNSNAKLTAKEVRYIRECGLTGPELGSMLGVTKTQVYRIRARKAWAHVK